MQLRKILVAVKPGAADAHPVPLALDLASRAQARLAILSVTAAARPPAGPVRPLIEPRRRDRVAVHTATGVPAVEIARWSETEGADLVVLGCEPRVRAGRLDCGATVEGTVRRARVPCLIAPAGAAGCRRIMAAVDGGPDSHDVLDAALTLGRLWDAAVRALHVAQPALAGAVATAGSHGPPDRRADPLHGLAATGELIVRQGDPVAEVLRAVREDAVDLLVLGHHRGGPADAHGTGSIAARLLARAPCAVLTIPI